MTTIAIILVIIIFLVAENIYFRFKIHWRDEEIKKLRKYNDEEIKKLRKYNESVLQEDIDNHNLFICAKSLIEKYNIRQELIDKTDEMFDGYYHDKLVKELFGDD